MNDDTTTPDDLREQTAEAAPEVAEHDRISALQAEIEELRSKVLYAQAETQNVRRRLEKDAADAKAYAATGFARDMLSIADNLSRALGAIPAEVKADEKLKPLVTGIEATGKELDSIFARHGVTKIAALGAKLDPNLHQAMVELPSDQDAGIIVQEMQAGYTLKERLLRPALVGVSKGA